jgi:hypothetical protein
MSWHSKDGSRMVRRMGEEEFQRIRLFTAREGFLTRRGNN